MTRDFPRAALTADVLEVLPPPFFLQPRAAFIEEHGRQQDCHRLELVQRPAPCETPGDVDVRCIRAKFEPHLSARANSVCWFVASVGRPPWVSVRSVGVRRALIRLPALYIRCHGVVLFLLDLQYRVDLLSAGESPAAERRVLEILQHGIEMATALGGGVVVLS
jgi:hypothetical protein